MMYASHATDTLAPCPFLHPFGRSKKLPVITYSDRLYEYSSSMFWLTQRTTELCHVSYAELRSSIERITNLMPTKALLRTASTPIVSAGMGT